MENSKDGKSFKCRTCIIYKKRQDLQPAFLTENEN